MYSWFFLIKYDYNGFQYNSGIPDFCNIKRLNFWMNSNPVDYRITHITEKSEYL